MNTGLRLQRIQLGFLWLSSGGGADRETAGCRYDMGISRLSNASCQSFVLPKLIFTFPDHMAWRCVCILKSGAYEISRKPAKIW